jgi:pimeloyl-ACP methyl ester carboxylesterase
VPDTAVRRAVGSTYRVLAFASPRRAEDSVVNAFTSHLGTQHDVARMLDTGKSLLPEIKAPFRLQRIECPVLVIWGERDRMVFPKGAELIVAALPEARVELIDRCGICPKLEQTARLVELLAGFPA